MKKIYFTILTLALFCISASAQTVIPTTDELILPQYTYYGGTLGSRVPVVCRLTLSGLSANTTYRYTTGLSSTSNITTSFAAGNFIHISNNTDATYGNILGFTSQKGLNGAYLTYNLVVTSGTTNYFGKFTTDGTGSYTGWFATVSIGNATQEASGSDAYFYINLGPDTSPVYAPTQSYRTTSTIKLLDYSTTTGGLTALVGTTSNIGDEKLVSIYDNSSFTGRPLYTTFTENDGLNLTLFNTWYTTAATSNVNGVSGKWGAVIPNTLSTGVRGIKFYNPSDGSEIVVGNGTGNISTDGVWNGVTTVNPSGGTTPIEINSIAQTTLPIKLVDFSSAVKESGVQLNWQTAQEINNQYFDLLRSGDGKNFTSIAKLDGAGNSTQNKYYSYIDYAPQKGTNYYQLKQVDFDGKSTLSNIIAAKFGLADDGIKVSSVSDHDIILAITLSKAQQGIITYTSLDGKILYQKELNLVEGLNSVSVPADQSLGKIGILSFSSASGRQSVKISR